MEIVRILFGRTFTLLAVVLILATASYALAGANAVALSGAGSGQGAITSYTVDPGSIQVSLDTDNDPTTILKVRFTIAPVAGGSAPKTVRASFVTSGGAAIGGWYGACTNLSGTIWECLPSGTVAHAQVGIQLRVVAAQ